MLILAFLWILYLGFKWSVILTVRNKMGGSIAENQAAYEGRPVAEIEKSQRETLVFVAIAIIFALVAWLFRLIG